MVARDPRPSQPPVGAKILAGAVVGILGAILVVLLVGVLLRAAAWAVG